MTPASLPAIATATATATDSTDSPIQTRWVRLAGPQGEFEAYLATPPAGRGPGLLLLQEIFGVNPHIRGVAEQWALAGYTVLVPDLFWRERPRVELGYVGADRDEALRLMKTLGREAAVADMQTAITWLRSQAELCSGRVAALGYCMGGRLAFAAAALCGVDAAVCYYGGGIAAQPDLADLVARITVPVQFHHAGEDHAIPPEAVASVQAAMLASPAAASAASAPQFHLYPGAQHGFNCWSRASYQPASAALALGRSLQFLAPLFEG